MSINYEELAQKHQVSIVAVQHLAHAIARGNGQQAQFNHPELGGMGQWMPTMLMIGDAFNYTLKAKVDVLCHELAQAYRQNDIDSSTLTSNASVAKWWSGDYGYPTFDGGQNSIRYAYFMEQSCLIIHQNGHQTIYDTSPHILSGVSQQQSNTINHLSFHTKNGENVTLDDFKLKEK